MAMWGETMATAGEKQMAAVGVKYLATDNQWELVG